MHLSKEAKRQNLRALKLLFGYLKTPGGDLEEQGQAFLDIARGAGAATSENSTSNNNNNNHHYQQWAQDNIIYFLISQRKYMLCRYWVIFHTVLKKQGPRGIRQKKLQKID
jgi:hypothetical protein